MAEAGKPAGAIKKCPRDAETALMATEVYNHLGNTQGSGWRWGSWEVPCPQPPALGPALHKNCSDLEPHSPSPICKQPTQQQWEGGRDATALSPSLTHTPRPSVPALNRTGARAGSLDWVAGVPCVKPSIVTLPHHPHRAQHPGDVELQQFISLQLF